MFIHGRSSSDRPSFMAPPKAPCSFMVHSRPLPFRLPFQPSFNQIPGSGPKSPLRPLPHVRRSFPPLRPLVLQKTQALRRRQHGRRKRTPPTASSSSSATRIVDTHRVLGTTHDVLVLQDFEALTPNLVARTVETVQGGGLVILLLRTVKNLRQLYAMSMDVHSRYRRRARATSCRGSTRGSSSAWENVPAASSATTS